jgi:diazepam-binding inhibitor (GABA receptor modulating acyl-CoA-binding protein)
MADIKKQFQTAASEATKLAKTPNNDQKLELYALYKQASEGDVKGSRPGMLDLTGRAKFDAWSKKKGLTSEQAMQQYVDFVSKLKKSG